jgi:hypothetical protein
MSKWLQDFFQYKAIVEANLTVTSAATVQQYYKYTYDSTVYVQGDAGTYPSAGFIRFNDANTATATQVGIANQTSESQGIDGYISDQPVGALLHVRSTQENKFSIYEITVAATGVAQHRRIGITPINGLALTDGDEVTISFESLANVQYNATTEVLSSAGVDISGYSTAATFANLPAATGFTVPEVYWVTDPGIWVMCDTTLDAWVPLNNIGRLYRNAAPIKSTAPATVASAIADNGSGKVRVTAASHLMTSTQDDFEVYISAWAGTGVAGRYRVTSVDANNYDLPDLNYDVALGLPTVALCKGGAEKVLAAEIDLPPLTSKAVIRVISSSIFTDSAEDRRIVFALMKADRSSPVIFNNRNDTAATNTGQITNWGFKNRGATNSQQGLAILTQSGSPGTGTTAYPVESTIQTNVATKIQIYNILGDATTGTPQNYTINDLAVYWEN